MTATYRDPRVRYGSIAYDYQGNPVAADGEADPSFRSDQSLDASAGAEHTVEVTIS